MQSDPQNIIYEMRDSLSRLIIKASSASFAFNLLQLVCYFQSFFIYNYVKSYCISVRMLLYVVCGGCTFMILSSWWCLFFFRLFYLPGFPNGNLYSDVSYRSSWSVLLKFIVDNLLLVLWMVLSESLTFEHQRCNHIAPSRYFWLDI